MKWMILTPKQIIKFRKYKITKKESEKDKITFAIEEFKKIKSKDIVELTKEDFPEEEIIDNKIKK